LNGFSSAKKNVSNAFIHHGSPLAGSTQKSTQKAQKMDSPKASRRWCVAVSDRLWCGIPLRGHPHLQAQAASNQPKFLQLEGKSILQLLNRQQIYVFSSSELLFRLF
jgi:hypothetical protein